MYQETTSLIGHACSYTPTPLIHAAGLTPYRVLPMGDSPDRAGQLLHDNLCPHVKRILDRAMENDLPDLHGMVFMNCCDAMRRLSDAWRTGKAGSSGGAPGSARVQQRERNFVLRRRIDKVF